MTTVAFMGNRKSWKTCAQFKRIQSVIYQDTPDYVVAIQLGVVEGKSYGNIS